jgi:hypothetical protein
VLKIYWQFDIQIQGLDEVLKIYRFIENLEYIQITQKKKKKMQKNLADK